MKSARILWGSLALSLVVLLLHVVPAWGGKSGKPAQRLTSGSFSDIVAGNPAEYATYQVKLTYTSAQTKTTPTLLLAGNGRGPDVLEFLPYRYPGVNYSNDGVHVVPLSTAGSTIERFVEGLAERPPLQVSGGSTNPALSLMIERGLPPSEVVFEHRAGGLEAQQILTVLKAAARFEPPDSREQIRRFTNFTVGP